MRNLLLIIDVCVDSYACAKAVQKVAARPSIPRSGNGIIETCSVAHLNRTAAFLSLAAAAAANHLYSA